MTKNKDRFENIKDTILREYEKGNIVFWGIDILQVANLEEFIKQPIEGILYDLNRMEEVVLTFIKDRKWVDDYAVAKVIRLLKKQNDELKKEIKGLKRQ